MHILMYGGESFVTLHWYILADEEDQEIMQLIKYLEMKREIRELRENVSWKLRIRHNIKIILYRYYIFFLQTPIESWLASDVSRFWERDRTTTWHTARSHQRDRGSGAGVTVPESRGGGLPSSSHYSSHQPCYSRRFPRGHRAPRGTWSRGRDSPSQVITLLLMRDWGVIQWIRLMALSGEEKR